MGTPSRLIGSASCCASRHCSSTYAEAQGPRSSNPSPGSPPPTPGSSKARSPTSSASRSTARSSPRSAAPPPSPSPIKPVSSRLQAAAARAVPGPRAPRRLPRRAQHHGQRAAVVAQRFLVHAAPRGIANAPRIAEASVAGDRRRARRRPKERRSRRERARLAPAPLEARRAARCATRSPASRRTMTGSSPIRSSSSAARSAPRRAPRQSLFSDLLARRPGQSPDDRRVRQPAAAAAARSHEQRRVLLGRRAGRIARRLERARRDEPERSQLVDARRQLRRQGAGPAPISVRHVVQPAALRGRQHRRAGRRCPTRRATSARCSRYDEWQISPLRRRRATAPATRTTTTCDGPAQFSPRCQRDVHADRSRGACAPSASRDVSAPGAEEFMPPSSRRVPAAAAHVLAALEGGHPDAGACRTTSSASSAC